MTGAEEFAIAVLALIGIVLTMIPYAAIFGVPMILIAVVLLVVAKLKPPTDPDRD